MALSAVGASAAAPRHLCAAGAEGGSAPPKPHDGVWGVKMRARKLPSCDRAAADLRPSGARATPPQASNARGHVLGLYWGCAGTVLELYRCPGAMLVLNEFAPGQYWCCMALALHSRCTGTALLLYWDCTSSVLVLLNAPPGPLHHQLATNTVSHNARTTPVRYQQFQYNASAKTEATNASPIQPQ